MKKILNLKQVIMKEFQNTKTFLLKDMPLLGQKKLLLLEKLKIQFHDEKEKFDEKELQKTNQKEFRIEKVIKRKGNKLYVKWKKL